MNPFLTERRPAGRGCILQRWQRAVLCLTAVSPRPLHAPPAAAAAGQVPGAVFNSDRDKHMRFAPRDVAALLRRQLFERVAEELAGGGRPGGDAGLPAH